MRRGRGRPPLDKARKSTHTVRFDEEEEAEKVITAQEFFGGH